MKIKTINLGRLEGIVAAIGVVAPFIFGGLGWLLTGTCTAAILYIDTEWET